MKEQVASEEGNSSFPTWNQSNIGIMRITFPSSDLITNGYATHLMSTSILLYLLKGWISCYLIIENQAGNMARFTILSSFCLLSLLLLVPHTESVRRKPTSETTKTPEGKETQIERRPTHDESTTEGPDGETTEAPPKCEIVELIKHLDACATPDRVSNWVRMGKPFLRLMSKVESPRPENGGHMV